MLKHLMVALASAAAIGVGFASNVEAAVLGSYQRQISESTAGGSWQGAVSIGGVGFGFSSNTVAGTTFTVASNADDPEYSTFVALLTNGNSDSISLEESLFFPLEGIGIGIFQLPDETLLFGVPAGTDFLGSSIASISLTLNEVFLDGYSYTLAINSETSEDVPEPASMLGLLAVGAVAAGGALKKKAAA